MKTPRALRLGLATGLLCLTALASFPAVADTSTYVSLSGDDCDDSAPAGLTVEQRLRCYAPVFVVEESQDAYNRIGSPRLTYGWTGGLRVHVDPARPALYAEIREDQVAGVAVQQLVYRVHFEKIPLRFSRYFFEAHRNPGLLFVVTLDAARGVPLFVTLAHTCGCYTVILPTGDADAAWHPADRGDTVRIYGQTLPSRLPAFTPRERLHVTIAPYGHRVSDVRVAAESSTSRVELPLLPLGRLRSMPVEGGAGEHGSIFYTSGLTRGHVRGAWNPMEGLTIFGLVSLDPRVGMDKDFGDPAQTGTRFYTQLRFWAHDRTRLDRFESTLREFGFRVPETSKSLTLGTE